MLVDFSAPENTVALKACCSNKNPTFFANNFFSSSVADSAQRLGPVSDK